MKLSALFFLMKNIAVPPKRIRMINIPQSVRVGTVAAVVILIAKSCLSLSTLRTYQLLPKSAVNTNAAAGIPWAESSAPNSQKKVAGFPVVSL